MKILDIHLRAPARGLTKEVFGLSSAIAFTEMISDEEHACATKKDLANDSDGRGDSGIAEHSVFVSSSGYADKILSEERNYDIDTALETFGGSPGDENMSNCHDLTPEARELTSEEDDIGVKPWSRSKRFRHAVSLKKLSRELSGLKYRERHLHIDLATKTAASREHRPRRNFALEDVAGIIKLEQSLENLALLIRKKELVYTWRIREREIHDLRLQVRDRKMSMGPRIYPVLNDDDDTKISAMFKIFQSEIEGYRRRIIKKKAEVKRIESILLREKSLSDDRLHLALQDGDMQTVAASALDLDFETEKSPSFLLSVSPQKKSTSESSESAFSKSCLSISFTFCVESGPEHSFLEMQLESAVATQVEGLLSNFEMSYKDIDSSQRNMLTYFVSCETVSCLAESEYATVASWAAALSTKLRSSWFEESLVQTLHVKVNIVRDSVKVAKSLPSERPTEVPSTPVTSFKESTEQKSKGTEGVSMLTPSSPSESSGAEQHLSTRSHEAENTSKIFNAELGADAPESPHSFSSSKQAEYIYALH